MIEFENFIDMVQKMRRAQKTAKQSNNYHDLIYCRQFESAVDQVIRNCFRQMRDDDVIALTAYEGHHRHPRSDQGRRDWPSEIGHDPVA